MFYLEVSLLFTCLVFGTVWYERKEGNIRIWLFKHIYLVFSQYSLTIISICLFLYAAKNLLGASKSEIDALAVISFIIFIPTFYWLFRRKDKPWDGDL